MKDSFYKKMQFVQVGNLPVLQQGGLLKFNIPGRIGQIEARATRVKAISANNYEWYGNIDGGLGTMIVLNKNGKLSASIYLPGQVYEIISTDNDTHILITYDNEKSETLNKCGTDEKKKLKTPENKPPASLRIDPCQDNTRVLVLYTPAAEAAVADINQTIDLCISQFNQSVFNSAINTNAYIELAGSQLYNFTETFNNMDVDLDRVINDATAQTIRNNTNADYVILLTNGNYGGAYGAAGSIEPDNANSYAIVQAITATNERKTFTHEAGHLYGCRHDNDLGGQPYAHGYIFRPGFLAPRCYTVMVNGSSITGSRARLLNFSNPDVSIDGAATGTTTTNHNARRVTETFAILRSFRNSPYRPLTAAIEGTQTGDECSQGNWEAVVSCGTAPYTYQWNYSYDGFTYYYAGSGEFYSATLTCPVGLYQNYYVMLSTTDANGQTVTSFLTVYVNQTSGGGGPKYRIVGNRNPIGIKQPKNIVVKTITSNQLLAYPNPAKDIAQIAIQLKEAQRVKLEIINSSGQSVKVLFEGSLEVGIHLKNVDITRFPKGMYLYKLTGKAFSLTQKLIIQ